MNILKISKNFAQCSLQEETKLREESHNFILLRERGRRESNIRDRSRRN